MIRLDSILSDDELRNNVDDNVKSKAWYEACADIKANVQNGILKTILQNLAGPLNVH